MKLQTDVEKRALKTQFVTVKQSLQDDIDTKASKTEVQSLRVSCFYPKGPNVQAKAFRIWYSSLHFCNSIQSLCRIYKSFGLACLGGQLSYGQHWSASLTSVYETIETSISAMRAVKTYSILLASFVKLFSFTFFSGNDKYIHRQYQST